MPLTRLPPKHAPLTRHYYDNTDALIYLVDSNDPERISEARDELHRVLAADGLRGAAVLILANKQDLTQAMRPDRVADLLGLSSMRDHKWYMQPCSAVTGDGLYEGLDWLNTTIRARSKSAAAA